MLTIFDHVPTILHLYVKQIPRWFVFSSVLKKYYYNYYIRRTKHIDTTFVCKIDSLMVYIFFSFDKHIVWIIYEGQYIHVSMITTGTILIFDFLYSNTKPRQREKQRLRQKEAKHNERLVKTILKCQWTTAGQILFKCVIKCVTSQTQYNTKHRGSTLFDINRISVCDTININIFLYLRYTDYMQLVWILQKLSFIIEIKHFRWEQVFVIPYQRTGV